MIITNSLQNEVYKMDALVIRQATRKDIHQIRKVLISSHWFTYEKLYTKKQIQTMIDVYYNLGRLTEEIKCINATWHGYIIAEQENTIIGVIGGGMRDKKDSEVYVLYLDPETRQQGIGTLLLNHLTKIQKFTYGAVEQWVAVAKGNDYAIPFYEARGYIFQYASPSYAPISEKDIALWYKRKI